MGVLSFDLQAHRGGAGLAPENTLAAFGNALTVGVSTLECDVHITADGIPVLSHERTYCGQVIPLLTYAELAALHPPAWSRSRRSPTCSVWWHSAGPTRSG